MVSHPEIGSDSPIGSDRELGRDIHSRRVLSFFLENNIDALQGEVLGLIKPLSNNSCN